MGADGTAVQLDGHPGVTASRPAHLKSGARRGGAEAKILAATSDKRFRLSTASTWVLPLAAYAALAMCVYSPPGSISATHLTTTGEDVAPLVWDLAALPHYLLHGQNPFFTLDANFPFGGNLASNTSMPFLGLLASPITMTFGPIAAYNAMAIVGFFLSAMAMFCVLRKCVHGWLAAFVGGLVYGFGPFMIAQGYDHVYLTFEPLPPLILAVCWELVVRGTWRPRRSGLLLGLLAAVEFLISAEVFAEVALLAAFGIVVLALRYPRLVSGRWRRVVSGLAWALLPFVVLAGYPIGYMTFGPQHLTGAPQPFELASFRADLLGPVIPTVVERIGPTSLKALGSRFGGGDFVENGIYLGVPLVLLSVVTVVSARRRGIVRIAGLLLLTSFVLSLGSPLMIDGRNTGIPLPFGLFPHLPFVQNESALRYSLIVDLFAGVLLAQGMDHFFERRRARLATLALGVRSKSVWFLAAPVAGSVVLATTLVSLVPNIPYSTTSAGIPAYFTDGSASRIASGSVVLTYPYPFWPYTQPDIWSADTELRFKLFGGPVISPQNPTIGVGEGTPPLLWPYLMQELFATATYGAASYVYGSSLNGFTLPQPNDPSTITQLRSFCLTYTVGDIVIDSTTPGSSTVMTYLTDALGVGPVADDGVQVWYGVQADIGRLAP